MPVCVKIPGSFRKYANDQREIWLEANDVADLLSQISESFPNLGDRVREADGSPKPFIGIYVNEEDIRFISGTETQLSDGDEVLIVPAIAGG